MKILAKQDKEKLAIVVYWGYQNHFFGRSRFSSQIRAFFSGDFLHFAG